MPAASVLTLPQSRLTEVVEDAVRDAASLGAVHRAGDIRFEVRRGHGNLWIVATRDGRDIAALRAGHGADELTGPVTRIDGDDATIFEFSSALGAFRAKISFPTAAHPLLRCTTSVIPRRDSPIAYWPRDLYPLGAPEGTVHTAQRGLRSGIVFASAASTQPVALFYLQNFSALTEYLGAVKRSPADTVGGSWPALGYAPPAGEDCVLPRSRDFVVSDALLTLAPVALDTDARVAAAYLDMLADTYLALDRPETTYHDWPTRAAQTLRDLSVSPDCTYVRDGRRYLMPYVGDDTKPPESMVQLTLDVNTREYDSWRNEQSGLAAMLSDNAASFYNPEIGSLVRWLPSGTFKPDQADDNMSHEAMDSWYLHHALFNLSRLALDSASARDIFARSMPYLIRVARRFDYTWPIFFNLKTLDVLKAESEPGKGGENDVGGLYALVMIHAHQLLGDTEYLDEAKRAVQSLRGFGFRLGYQLNTTGFAAEASMRLWKITGDRTYLELSEICMANLFDNMWLWQCDYGRAVNYRTFFGLFPLHDAPYLAAYEELEAQAKFHDYFSIGGDSVRPALKLLLAEYQKYGLDRGWYYYPDALPKDVLGEKPRNGRVERALSIPLEDLQDGLEASGQVGQEIYGAGLAFVFTSRHYVELPNGCLAYCDYPAFDFRLDGKTKRATWRIGGDRRATCALRIIPTAPNMARATVEVTADKGAGTVPLRGTVSPEGHALFAVSGNTQIHIRFVGRGAKPRAGSVEIGGLPHIAAAGKRRRGTR